LGDNDLIEKNISGEDIPFAAVIRLYDQKYFSCHLTENPPADKENIIP